MISTANLDSLDDYCQVVKTSVTVNNNSPIQDLRSAGQSYSTYLWELILFTFCLFIQTTDVDWTEAVIPFAIIVFLVFIFDFYIESFCLAKLESTRTGKVGSIASFLSAVILSFLWDQPWAWSMHEWHHGKPSEPHLVSAGTLFAAFFFVLGEWFDANISSLLSAGKWKVEGMTCLSQSKWVSTIKVLFLLQMAWILAWNMDDYGASYTQLSLKALTSWLHLGILIVEWWPYIRFGWFI